MSGKHTPGPWMVRNNDTVVGPKGNVVAECCGYSVKAEGVEQKAQGGREANANLIAAAPELLEALERIAGAIYEDGRKYGHTDASGFVKIAQDAIAKAKGEQSMEACQRCRNALGGCTEYMSPNKLGRTPLCFTR